ncbi:MAG TPA: ribosome biogenesis GTPase Der [Tissierellia bacterium]|jgi:GTP-binding protein|nr:ribosome biogenesis GTPase Der [Tissierellia bacterium]
MSKPVVAIVGRPNVGKSTFFNKVVGERISIEQETPGVTRDRVYADAEWLGREFTLIDTGGLDPKSDDHFQVRIREQAMIAADLADVILFMVNGREGVSPIDQEVAMLLRISKKPIIMVVNQIDSLSQEQHIYDFYSLGFNPIGISSVNALNLGDLLDEIISHFPPASLSIEEEESISVAVVGKPNVGKSSLVNLLLGEERLIVSPIAGTTREAIDTTLKAKGRVYKFIDTAGIRRKKQLEGAIEHYAVLRSFYAIDRADIAILVVDAQEGFTEQDKKIVGHAHDGGKGILVLVNKWDLLDKDHKTYNEWKSEFRREFPFLKYASVEMISVIKRERVHRLLPMIDRIQENRMRRIPTGVLNDLLQEAVLMHELPSDKGRRLKIYYITQSSVAPPTFVLFVNSQKLMHFSYQRYLENRIRESFDFEGTPLHFVLKEREK